MARREAESRYEGPSRAAAVRAARIARGWAGPTGSAERGRRGVDAQRCLARRLPVHFLMPSCGGWCPLVAECH